MAGRINAVPSCGSGGTTRRGGHHAPASHIAGPIDECQEKRREGRRRLGARPAFIHLASLGALERVLSLREAHRKFPTMKSQVSGCLKYCVWAILSTFGALPKYLTAPSSSGLPSIVDVPSVGTIKSLKLFLNRYCTPRSRTLLTSCVEEKLDWTA